MRGLKAVLAPFAGRLLVFSLPISYFSLQSSGCARPTGAFFTRPQGRLVWPPSPEKPRIEYLGEFAGAIRASGDRSFGKAWNEFLYGPENPPSLVTPHAVAMNADGTHLAVADPNAVCVHLLDLDRQTYRRIDGSPAADILLTCPIGVAWAGEDLYIVDSELHAVIRVAGVDWKADRRESGTASVSLIAQDTLRRPAGIAYNATNDRLYVTDSWLHSVLVFDRSGLLVKSFGERGGGEGQFNFPSQITCSAEGAVLVADSMNFRVQRFSAEGEFLSEFGQKGDASGDFALPKGVAVDAQGSIWVVDAQFENVQAFTADGRLLMAIGGEGHGPGEFWLPAGVTIDARKRMWVADSYNRRVQGFQLLP
ncbi:MAG: 6-bladed beta-propeller [Phycisphaerales bacterium]|nr:6-bladed beta-propeller [Phycisphaerales bacterium]